jgi:hypothetical protein
MDYREYIRQYWDDQIRFALKEHEERAFEGKEDLHKSPAEIDAILKLYQECLANKDYDRLLNMLERAAQNVKGLD